MTAQPIPTMEGTVETGAKLGPGAALGDAGGSWVTTYRLVFSASPSGVNPA